MKGPTPIDEALEPEEEEQVRRILLRMSVQSVGICTGLLFGIGLFVATTLLVLRGGENVGTHLGLLAAYFPGYRVTLVGSLIGFAYASVLGYGIGLTIAFLYNRLVD